MNAKNTLKRIGVAFVAVSALTVVGATGAQAAVQSGSTAKPATVTITVSGDSVYAKAFNACTKTEVAKKAKALKNAKTKAKTVKAIKAKCAKVAKAVVAAETASPASAGTGATVTGGVSTETLSRTESANTGKTLKPVSGLTLAQTEIYYLWIATGADYDTAFSYAYAGKTPAAVAASTNSTGWVNQTANGSAVTFQNIPVNVSGAEQPETVCWKG